MKTLRSVLYGNINLRLQWLPSLFYLPVRMDEETLVPKLAIREGFARLGWVLIRASFAYETRKVNGTFKRESDLLRLHYQE